MKFPARSADGRSWLVLVQLRTFRTFRAGSNSWLLDAPSETMRVKSETFVDRTTKKLLKSSELRFDVKIHRNPQPR